MATFLSEQWQNSVPPAKSLAAGLVPLLTAGCMEIAFAIVSSSFYVIFHQMWQLELGPGLDRFMRRHKAIEFGRKANRLSTHRSPTVTGCSPRPSSRQARRRQRAP